MNEPTVSASDIARLAGVGRAAVSNWRRRYEDFPTPLEGTSSNPRFVLAHVEKWLAEQGKLQPGAHWERLWRVVEAYRGAREPADVLGRIGAYLVRGEPGGLAPQLLTEVAELAGTHGGSETYEGLWQRFLRDNARWVSGTPPEIASLMVALTGVRSGVVLDPACGAGSVLAEVPGRVRLLGQEIDKDMAAIGAARLALRGADANLRIGDSLLADAHRGQVADAVVCDPPFNERHWGHDELIQDPRWQYGIPPRMESELAWAQHVVAHLKPGGVAVMTMPPSVASRRSGRRIRAELVRSGVLRAVISLPPIASAVPAHLWVLRGAPAPVAESVLVVDAEGVDRRRLAEIVVTAWRQFDKATVSEQPGVVRAVPVLDLLRAEVDLTPVRNLPVHSALNTPERLGAKRNELVARLEQLAPGLLPTHWGPAEHRAMSTVGELIASGAVNLLQANVPDQSDGPVPLLRTEDLLTGGRPSGRADGGYVTAQPGDVVIPATGRQFTVRVMAEPVVLGRGLCLLRPNPKVLDPWFLAGFLGSSANARQAVSHLSTGSRLDVKRCQIPRMPLAEQQRYADVYRRVGAFADAVDDVRELAHSVIQGMTDGMAEGVITPR
nr:SAM-dependent methyltransferase [Kibdelosporangium sp. MJ126-NF4]CEL18946.1 Type I restriction-modification system, DNA-methyltransferase subunit M [Kibdelosporangium sp. MJ126-NF4]CTQ95251.1 Type I restriction-modification system, DNA-methyltransferase subunit M (EC 2.1.1.72) [Kibdelosporangium sp. MJ126-NF4]